MKSSPKLFLSLFPGFIVGMFFQHQITNHQPEATALKMDVVTKDVVDLAADRYMDAGSIGKFQKINGATFSKEEALQIINGANQDVYVRIGFDNNVMSIYMGNDNKQYISAEAFCPSNCPYNN